MISIPTGFIPHPDQSDPMPASDLGLKSGDWIATAAGALQVLYAQGRRYVCSDQDGGRMDVDEDDAVQRIVPASEAPALDLERQLEDALELVREREAERNLAGAEIRRLRLDLGGARSAAVAIGHLVVRYAWHLRALSTERAAFVALTAWREAQAPLAPAARAAVPRVAELERQLMGIRTALGYWDAAMQHGRMIEPVALEAACNTLDEIRAFVDPQPSDADGQVTGGEDEP